MTKEELKKATGQELIEQRDYCGRDNYYYEYLENINAEMLKRFNRLAELEAQNKWLEGCKLELGEHLGKANDKIADLEKENAELKEKVSFLEDNLRVARKDREDLQLDVAKGLKEFVKDYPATALRYLANEKYVEQFTKAKEHIKKLLDCLKQDTNDPQTNYYVCQYMDEAEQFLNSEVENDSKSRM